MTDFSEIQEYNANAESFLTVYYANLSDKQFARSVMHDNRYRPIIGRFADKRYWLISTWYRLIVVYTIGK